MTNPTPKRPHLFIEERMPVQLLNEQVYYEHGENPFKGLHRWYSRKPLSFSRASVLASLLPADVSMIALTACGGKVRWSLNPVSMTKFKLKSGCEGKRKTTGIIALPSLIFP